MTKKGQKFGSKWEIFGIVLKKRSPEKNRVENRKFFGKYLIKQVIGNLAYPEMLFTKKALMINKFFPCVRSMTVGYCREHRVCLNVSDKSSIDMKVYQSVIQYIKQNTLYQLLISTDFNVI